MTNSPNELVLILAGVFAAHWLIIAILWLQARSAERSSREWRALAYEALEALQKFAGMKREAQAHD